MFFGNDSDSQNSSSDSQNVNNFDSEESTISIDLISYSQTDTKIKSFPEDIMISVRNMQSPDKHLRDRYDGTSIELQKNLLNNSHNNVMYSDIVNTVIDRIKELMLLSDSDESLTVYVGCEKGRHRSVAVVCMLEQSIIEYLKNNKKNKKNVEINVCHRELEKINNKETRKAKKLERSKDRDQKFKNMYTWN
jgi:RNase adaptor protein for sRNA GlmZ degradation